MLWLIPGGEMSCIGETGLVVTGADCNKGDYLYTFCIITSESLLQLSTGSCATFEG